MDTPGGTMDTPGGFPVQWKWRSKRTVVSENRNHAKKLKAAGKVEENR